MAEYIISSGEMSSGIILNSVDSMTILNGGIATVTKGKGRIYVSSGGTANSTSINSSGSMTISSGGIANFTSAYDWKSYIYVSFGGIVNSTNIRYGGTIHVSYGGVANNTIIDSAGDLYISKGGTANSATVNSKGELHVSSGGTALEIRENGGFVSVEDGANVTFTSNTIKNLVLSTYFSATVHSGTITSMTTISSKGYMLVYSGGKANNTIVNSKGCMSVYSGGTAKRITVNSCGSMRISSGGTALDITENGGFVSDDEGANVTFVLNTFSGLVLDNDNRSATVHSRTTAVNTIIYDAGLYVYGGIANDTIVNGFGSLYVASGGMANNTAMNRYGFFSAFSGGIANDTTVNSGSFCIASGGTANRTTVNADGSMSVASGGTALEIKENGGFVAIANGANVTFAPNMIKGEIAIATIHSGTSADKPTLNMGGQLYIYSGGFATEIKENGGFVSVEEGASVTFAHNTINGITLSAIATIHSGTVTNGITISGYGRMSVYSGGIINDTDVIVSGGIHIELYSGAVANNTEIMGWGEAGMIVSSGGTANHTVINLSVFNRPVRSAGLTVIGGTANDTTVNSGGFSISSGGTANRTTVNADGSMSVASGGTALEIKENGGFVDCSSEAVVSFKQNSFNGLIYDATVHSGTTANIVTVKHRLEVYSGGTAISASVDNSGVLHIFFGGLADNTMVNSRGSMYVSSGGIASNTTVNSGGSMYVSSGGKLTGKTVFEKGAVVSAYGMILDFDLTQTSPGADSLVNDLSRIKGAPLYTLTVGGTLTRGTYSLAGHAEGFDKTFTVQNTVGTKLGTLTLGQTAKIDGVDYTLNLNDSLLSVTVSGAEPPPPTPGTKPTKSDRDGNGVSDVMFVWTGEHGEGNYQHGYWMNGTSTWQSANSTHPAEWENLGCYDMTGDGKADSVLVGNVEVGGVKGAYIGYYLDSVDTDANWQNIGYLNNADNIAWKNKVGNLTGNASGTNSIVWYAPDLYALGAWKDGKEDWVTLSGSFGGEAWTLVGCGDFNGDGKDSVLMSYNKGQLFYSVGIDGVSQAHGSANWSNGWEVRAIGDFAGDGRDDLVLFHEETGSMVMCADGNVDSFVSIGQLDPTDWFIAGCGDYNADGTDDLLVRQYSTGMLGYYSNGIQANWNVMGYGVGMEWTVIA